MASSLPPIDPSAVQRWYDAYIEALGKNQAERLADHFFTYPVIYGDRLVETRDQMVALERERIDRLREERSYSHSVMTPVRVEPLVGTNAFILFSSGTRFKTDGGVLEVIANASHLCAAVGNGEFRMLMHAVDVQAGEPSQKALPALDAAAASAPWSLPPIDTAVVQKWFDRFIEAWSANQPEQLADHFAYPCPFAMAGGRLSRTREETIAIFGRAGDRLIEKDNYSHSVMEPIRIQPLTGSNAFILFSSGKRFRRDGSILENIEETSYLCMALGGGEYRIIHRQPLPKIASPGGGAKL